MRVEEKTGIFFAFDGGANADDVDDNDKVAKANIRHRCRPSSLFIELLLC